MNAVEAQAVAWRGVDAAGTQIVAGRRSGREAAGRQIVADHKTGAAKT